MCYERTYYGVMRFDFAALRPRVAELCRRYGVAELLIFGSVARGDAGPGSDVDVLYVRTPGNELGLEFLNFQKELATTTRYAASATDSSASCTAASKPAPPTTKPPPGHPQTTQHQRQLDKLSPWDV